MSTPLFADSPISGFNPAKIEDGGINTSINVTSFWANNVFTLQSIISDNWGSGSFTPSNINNADAYWYADAGFTYKGWRFAGFNRGELFIEANRDTVDIVRMIGTKQDLPVGKSFAIDIKSNGFMASGAELSKKIDLNSVVRGLNAGVTMRYLSAEMVQDGTINGTLTPTSPKTYNFNLAVDYVYDRNLLYKRVNSSAEGNGYSFDVGAIYNWENKLEASFLVRDLFGYIYWKNVPYTTAEANSDIKYFDGEGHQAFRPTIKGYEGYKNYTQKILLKADVDVTYKEGPIKLNGTVNLIEEQSPLYWANIEYSPITPLILSTGYNVNYNVYSAGVSYDQFKLKAYSDSFTFARAKALGLSLSFSHNW